MFYPAGQCKNVPYNAHAIAEIKCMEITWNTRHLVNSAGCCSAPMLMHSLGWHWSPWNLPTAAILKVVVVSSSFSAKYWNSFLCIYHCNTPFNFFSESPKYLYLFMASFCCQSLFHKWYFASSAFHSNNKMSRIAILK